MALPGVGEGRDQMACEGLAQQGRAFDTEQRSRGQVGIDHAPLGVDREVGDGREVVEIDEAVAHRGQVDLGPAQLFVLRLELRLMDLQFMQQLGVPAQAPGRGRGGR